MRSDFPTREMRRRIFELEEEVKRLRKEAGKDQAVGVGVSDDMEAL